MFTHTFLILFACTSFVLAAIAKRRMAFLALDQRATISVPGFENLPVHPESEIDRRRT